LIPKSGTAGLSPAAARKGDGGLPEQAVARFELLVYCPPAEVYGCTIREEGV